MCVPEKGTKWNRREYIPLAEGWGGWWFPPSLLRIFDDVWVLYYIILDFVGDVTCHLQYVKEQHSGKYGTQSIIILLFYSSHPSSR